jgi:2,4-dienoyl-CoA reductase-like NADH-dependent reductase (Old Yellow Enzyme family)
MTSTASKQHIKCKNRHQLRSWNSIACALRKQGSPFRAQVVPGGKLYRRHPKHRKREMQQEQATR